MIKEKLDRNFGLILTDVARLLSTEFDRRVRDLGLTKSQWWVLTYLFREDGLTQTELADLMELQKASLGRLLDRLETKQWIRRQADPHDRRANRIYLTKDAEPLVKEMRARAASLRRDALSGLSAIEREQFIDTLLMVKKNLTTLEPHVPVASESAQAPARKAALPDKKKHSKPSGQAVSGGSAR